MAELLAVCWLEIRGKIKSCMLSPDTTYAPYLVFTSTHLRGFKYRTVEAEVGISGQESKKLAVHLYPEELSGYPQREEIVPADRDVQYAKQRGDGWMEVELGEIFIDGGQDVDLEMSLMEVKRGNWKRGLIVEGIEVRPKEENRSDYGRDRSVHS